MLRDLEELLLQVIDPSSREYLREAVRCYQGGAYRAAVVIAVAAGMDDLRRKLALLATSGTASQGVKDAHKVIDKQFKDQQAFESTLLDQGLKIDLLTPSDEKKLRTLLQTRHLCGHPSGHGGSAEEARSAIAGVTDLILSRPALLGMSAVTDLLARIEAPTFFPKQEGETYKAVLREELKVLEAATYPALVSRLVEKLLALVGERAAANGVTWLLSPKKTALLNLMRALWALIAEPGIKHVVWVRINRLVDASDARGEALAILSGSDGDGLESAPQLRRMRALALVRRNLKMNFAVEALETWHSDGVLTDDEVDEFKVAIREHALSHKPSEELTAFVFSLDWAGVVPAYLDRLVENSGSGTWDTANPAILAVQALTTEQAAETTPEQRVKYLVNVADNAEGQWAAHAATALRADGLGSRTDLVGALTDQLADDASMILAHNVRSLTEILEKSAESQAAASLVEATKQAVAQGELTKHRQAELSEWLDSKQEGDAEPTEAAE